MVSGDFGRLGALRPRLSQRRDSPAIDELPHFSHTIGDAKKEVTASPRNSWDLVTNPFSYGVALRSRERMEGEKSIVIKLSDE